MGQQNTEECSVTCSPVNAESVERAVKTDKRLDVASGESVIWNSYKSL
jgi:hypothetical protein